MTDIFALGAQRLDWLTFREATIARNVANVDTPGYRPQDLKPFQDALDSTAVRMARTNVSHIAEGVEAGGAPRPVDTQGWETTISGNAVSLEQELARSAETTREASVTSAAMSAFQRITLAVVKG